MKNYDNIEIDINPEYTMMKKVKGNLYLSQEQIDILKSYNVDYLSCPNLKSIIFELESILEETNDDVIANLIDVLSERDYYENYNK